MQKMTIIFKKLQFNYQCHLNLKSMGNWTEKFKVGDLRG